MSEVNPGERDDSDDFVVVCDERGVDLTLIDEMLRLDPIERLRLNDRAVNAALELRRAFAREQ
jgi:hypothetical protein